jgi:hypothetical protein
LVDEVCEFYHQHGRCVALFTGNTGSGKSSIAILVTKRLNGTFCNTYSPITPGDEIERVYSRVSPSIQSPLILLIDEIDGILKVICTDPNQLRSCNEIPIPVFDKTGWNRLFDNMRFFPNLIVIMTSNMTQHDMVVNFGESYVRDCRINISRSLNTESPNLLMLCNNSNE